MSDTPRTDRQTGWVVSFTTIKSSHLLVDPNGELVHASFARDLERELRASNEIILQLKEELAESNAHRLRLIESSMAAWARIDDQEVPQ